MERNPLRAWADVENQIKENVFAWNELQKDFVPAFPQEWIKSWVLHRVEAQSVVSYLCFNV